MNSNDIDRIIEMAWEDRTTFDAIKMQFGVDEKDVIKIMRSNLKRSSFKLWRKRVGGRKTKHLKVLNKEGISTLDLNAPVREIFLIIVLLEPFY